MDEDELEAMVKGASLSVIPSLCEGFSLPMLESMACGVPTVAANSTCLPEVSGGILRYFDGESVEQIAETMYDVLAESFRAAAPSAGWIETRRGVQLGTLRPPDA